MQCTGFGFRDIAPIPETQTEETTANEMIPDVYRH